MARLVRTHVICSCLCSTWSVFDRLLVVLAQKWRLLVTLLLLLKRRQQLLLPDNPVSTRNLQLLVMDGSIFS